MGHVNKTDAGNWRANWRDATGKKKAKTFPTQKAAKSYLADVESRVSQGTYVDPHAGRKPFGQHADRWAAAHVTGARTQERMRSVLRTHVMPQWAAWPLGRIGSMDVQEWVSELAERLSPATVAKCYSTLSLILRAAVRERLIAVDPSKGVKLPSIRRAADDLSTISQEIFLGRLLPAVPEEHRALVSMAAGAGLRWGECAGLPWSAIDLSADTVSVAQVAEETSATVLVRPYPKTRAGRRMVPLAPFLTEQLRAHLGRLEREPDGRVLTFGTRTGTPLRRSNFRRQVWRPALVRAGLLGEVVEVEPGRWRAAWTDIEGVDLVDERASEREAVALVADRAAGGLRFHDLRHSYATWLITAGVPVNVAQRVLGHENPTTTLNIYTHVMGNYGDAVRAVFLPGPDDQPMPPPSLRGDAADFSPTFESNTPDDDEGEAA